MRAILKEEDMKIIRLILGRIILALDFLTQPRSPKLDAKTREYFEEQSRHLELYQFKACPFCVKVRRASKRLGLDLSTKDAKNDSQARDALLEGGGRVKVPCLRIAHADGHVEWMYESSDIVSFLEQRFSQPQ